MKCIEDEIPFEVPEGWEWCRFGSVVALMSGTTYPAEKELLSGTRLYVKVGDMNLPGNEYEISTSSRYLDEYNISHLIPVNSVIFPKRGGAIATNKKKLVLRDEILIDLNTMAFTPISPVNLMYCYYWFLSIDLGKINSGSSVPQINNKDIEPLLFPVPPTFEQERIVQAIVPLLDAEQKISAAGVEVTQIISRAKARILDLAIRGQLVPQNPDDEPASVLLERIRAEKEELIKQGKIKRDKKESIIFRGDDNSYYRYKGEKEVCIDDDLPYKLPDGWIWAILPEVVLFQEGPGILKKDFRDEGIPLIRISGLQSYKVLLDGCNYLDPVMVENKWKHFKLELGDIILCTSASIGKASIVGPEAVGAIPYTGQIRFKMTQALIREYFLYFANSNTYLNQINRMKTGNCIQHYGPTHLKEVYIPIPPFKEQERIIKQVASLLSSIHEIEESITM